MHSCDTKNEPESTRRLLVVDDEPEMIDTLCDIAEIYGWDAEGALSGEQALERFEAVPYDAVVMDVRMPGINGVQALRSMRKRRPHVPVILVTAHTAPALIDEAEDAGVTAVMSKPVRVANLFRRLDRESRDRSGAPS